MKAATTNDATSRAWEAWLLVACAPTGCRALLAQHRPGRAGGRTTGRAAAVSRTRRYWPRWDRWSRSASANQPYPPHEPYPPH